MARFVPIHTVPKNHRSPTITPGYPVDPPCAFNDVIQAVPFRFPLTSLDVLEKNLAIVIGRRFLHHEEIAGWMPSQRPGIHDSRFHQSSFFDKGSSASIAVEFEAVGGHGPVRRDQTEIRGVRLFLRDRIASGSQNKQTDRDSERRS